MEQPERLLTIEELAEYLKKTPSTINNWRSLGIGPPYSKVNGTVRYRVSDLKSWIEANTVYPAGKKAVAQ